MRREVKRMLSRLDTQRVFRAAYAFRVASGIDPIMAVLVARFGYTETQAKAVYWDFRKRSCRLRYGVKNRRHRRRARKVTR